MTKPLIGIGLISYNRPVDATRVAEHIGANLDHDKYDYKLVCSLDQRDTTGYETVGKIMSLIPHDNVGISVNKSVAMMNLQECDHVFLLEDDFMPVKKGWDTLYLNVHNESKLGLLNYCPKGVSEAETRPKRVIRYRSGTIIYEHTHVAQIMSITKPAMNRVGALDPQYQGYGFEHCDYTRRCMLAGLFPRAGFPFLKETWDYCEMLDIPNTTSEEVRKGQIDYNSKVFCKPLTRIFIPFTEIAEYMKGKM